MLRRIDNTVFELLPDGGMRLYIEGREHPLELSAMTAYAIYLFLRGPTVAPLLRQLDTKRQHEAAQERAGL